MGKSTACSRLIQPWHALCDDETIIVRNKLSGFLAHPFPTWNDLIIRNQKLKSWDVQKSVKLKTIFFLEQSNTCEVIKIKPIEASYLIFKSSWEVFSKYGDDLKKENIRLLRKIVFNNACVMGKSIQAYILRLTLDCRYWEIIEDLLDE